MGSLDIMRLLGEEDIPYDAVWPASSLWLTVGDTEHRIKHAESISISPVVFGIRKSLAEELGFVGREVSVNDLLEAIRNGKLPLLHDQRHSVQFRRQRVYRIFVRAPGQPGSHHIGGSAE